MAEWLIIENEPGVAALNTDQIRTMAWENGGLRIVLADGSEAFQSEQHVYVLGTTQALSVVRS
jgi:hypothetical protein